jgi:signal transduction histidine kinase/ActR/RegA family two-component response regulator
LTIFAGLVLSSGGAWLRYLSQERAQQADFDAASDNRVSALRRDLEALLGRLRALANAVSTAPPEERTHLIELANRIQAAHGPIRWVSLPRAAAESPQDYRGPEWNQLNGAGRTQVREAFRQAVENGREAATPGLPLLRKGAGQRVVFVFVPVIDPASHRVVGMLANGLYPSEYLEHSLGTLRPHGVHVELRDVEAPDELLYRHQSRKGGDVVPNLTPFTGAVELAGRRWQVLCTAAWTSAAVSGLSPWVFFGGGCVISLLLGAYLDAHVARAIRIQKKVEERTLELRESTRRLEREVLERRATEQALARARDEALASSRLKDQFLANVSHEIRTPINGVVGTIQMLSASPLDSQQQEAVQMLDRSARALRYVIDDILDMSRIEAGTLTLRHEPFRVHEVVEEALSAVSCDAAQKGLALTADVPARAYEACLGDPGRLRQVLLNLVCNAVKFTPAGGVSALVRPSAGSSGRWRFEVHDTGIGIDEADQKLIFQRFTQVDGGNSRRHGGAGLGLAISKQLVELMGGQIGVRSTPGQGTEFWFELPLEPAPETAPEAAAPAAVFRPGTGLKVLLAEDNPINQKVALWQLRRLGYDADCSSNGRDVLAALEQNAYAAVLMDCQMPEMDGFEATARIRQRHGSYRAIPIIALTANAMTGDRERCLAAGMDDYLAKPIELAALGKVLQKWARAESSRAVSKA